jgi:DNA-binding response OmpR family regulator
MKYTLNATAKKLSILLAEDYQPFRDDLRDILELYFNEVHCASDGKEALEMYKSYLKKNHRPYDLLISDIEMPYINGIKLVKEIRNITQNQEIVVISAYSHSEYLIEFINIGITQYILKPFRSEQLFDTLRLVCDNIEQKFKPTSQNNLIELGDSRIWDSDRKILLCENNVISLSKHCTVLLDILLQYQNRICPNIAILQGFEQHNIVVEPQNIRHHVLKLRKELPDTSIKSAYSEGYIITLP